jgi:hypothetical protein
MVLCIALLQSIRGPFFQTNGSQNAECNAHMSTAHISQRWCFVLFVCSMCVYRSLVFNGLNHN